MKLFSMRFTLSLSTILLLAISSIQAQTFTNGSALLPNEYHSGGCVGFTDMDGDGFDDLVVLDGSKTLHVLYQGPDGSFEDFDLGDVSGSSQWGMCVADFDNDGHKDVYSGGSYDGVHVEHITAPGVSTSMQLDNGSMFMQACNWADIDNDGNLDAFGCHDDALSRMWQGDGNGNLTPAPGLMPLEDYLLADYSGNDHSGNYGTVFCDFDNDGDIDLFIAKCRQFVNDPYDPRRINQLWVNDGNGNFTEEALERGLVFYEQSWTVDFADIDNDGDFDCLVTNHSTTLFIFENDGLGYFTNITENSGLEVEGFFLQAKMEDMDNDGYVDLVHSGGSHRYFHNNGDMTFTEVGGAFPGDDTMHSFALGDVNRDGSVDLYASYGGGYVSADYDHEDILWVNDGNDNNWITFELEGFQSNIDAVGAKVVITGDFGTQIREVRAGESYGITCAATCHFGLGLNESVTSVVIKWPSGLETVIDNPDINQYHTISEAPCLIDVEISASEYGFCPGESVVVTAPEGFVSYQWTNSDSESNEIVVSEGGNYSVMVFDTDGCAGISNIVSVVEIVGDAPTVSVEGNLDLCDGSVVILTASEASSWLWSNTENTQSITVTEAGTYSVSVVDVCGNSGGSEEFTVEVFESPVGVPTVSDIQFSAPEDVTFVSTDGENVRWYDAEVEGNLLWEGDTYSVNGLIDETTIWAASTFITSGDVTVGGELEPQETGQHHSNSNRWLEFDVVEDLLLKSVTVYANGAYERTFQLIDSFENVLEETTVFVEDGQFLVDLNFEVVVGEGYGLRSTSDDPQLWREGTDSDLFYPYDLGGLGAVTNSTAGPEFSYYYFFYKWEVEPLPIVCESARVSATASPVGINELNSIALEFFPNPVSKNGEVRVANLPSEPFTLELTDALGRTVLTSQSDIIAISGMEAGVYLVSIRRQSDNAVLGSSRLIVQ